MLVLPWHKLDVFFFLQYIQVYLLKKLEKKEKVDHFFSNSAELKSVCGSTDHWEWSL